MSASLLLPKDPRPSAVLPPRAPPPQLPAHRLHAGSSAAAIFPLRFPVEAPCVKLSDPAVRVMTDFDHAPAFTVAEDERIDGALDDMFRLGVRALVTARDGRVTGLVTSYDIQGERPRQLMARSADLRREDICVGDIRTPWSELPLVAFETLRDARVSDVLEIFDATECTHLMIVENYEDGSLRARGLVSRTRLRRQLDRII